MSEDTQADKIMAALRRLYPKGEVQRVLEDVAARRMPRDDFRAFVWHRMAKAATERVSKRRWELVSADLRHKATQLAVIYTMHCVYERAAKGYGDLSRAFEESSLWNWGSKVG